MRSFNGPTAISAGLLLANQPHTRMSSRSDLSSLFSSLTEGLSWTTNRIGMREQVHNKPEVAKFASGGKELLREEYNSTSFCGVQFS